MNFDLKFSAFVLYPLLALALAILFTLFIYRRTTPPVADWLRRVLAGLRSFVLAAALLLLFEPILSLAWQRSEKPVVAVLIDQSASMKLADSLGARGEVARKVLAMPWVNQLRERAEVAFFAFSDSLHAFTKDSLATFAFTGDGSNLTAALLLAKEKLASRQYGAAVLLSDGAYNLGTNPARTAETYGLPIVTVRLGGNQQTRDAMISEVVTNDIAYAETQLPVEISLAATGFNGRKTKLRIFEGEQELLTQEVELPNDNTQTVSKLALTPKALGLNRYEARLDALEHEQTRANNRRVFYVRVLKSKLNLWLFAGAPSPDYAFLKRALAGDPCRVLALRRLGALEHAVRDGPFARTPAPFRRGIGLREIFADDEFACFDGGRP
ncbi:MAG: vWA domain-containing protein, partial [candidate division KSB1 bacterium]